MNTFFECYETKQRLERKRSSLKALLSDYDLVVKRARDELKSMGCPDDDDVLEQALYESDYADDVDQAILFLSGDEKAEWKWVERFGIPVCSGDDCYYSRRERSADGYFRHAISGFNFCDLCMSDNEYEGEIPTLLEYLYERQEPMPATTYPFEFARLGPKPDLPCSHSDCKETPVWIHRKACVCFCKTHYPH